MMNRLLTTFVGLLFLCSSTSYAVVSVQGKLGLKNTKLETDGDEVSASGTTLRAGLHFDPIPLVPVGFGLSAGYDQLGKMPSDSSLSSITGYYLTPEVVAWLPLGDLQPYGRVGFSILGIYNGEGKVLGQNLDITYAGTGPQIALGVEYSLLPLISLLGEAEYSETRLTGVKGSLGGSDIKKDDIDSVTAKSTSFLVGAKVGF